MNDHVTSDHDAFPPGSNTPAGGRRAAAARWLIEGGRTAFFLRPRWQGLRASPGWIAFLFLCATLAGIAVQRLYIAGPAQFDLVGAGAGWLGSFIFLWVCYFARSRPLPLSMPPVPPVEIAPDTTHLYALALAQTVVLALLFGLVWGVPLQFGADLSQWPAWGQWAILLLPVLWIWLVQWRLIRHSVPLPKLAALIVAIGLTLSATLTFWPQAQNFWIAGEAEEADADADADNAPEPFALTQDVIESQAPVLAQRLSELRPQRPGRTELFGITFAPDGEADVFRRESEMVADVIGQRFDAHGHIVQLVNHRDTYAQWPWATPQNLQRTIEKMASVMDRDEDVLFLHLTSHGARDGELAADFAPLTVDTVTPDELKTWLDEAGIKHRVISISACFSGSWVDRLADDNTLVMTAADADHTSYGCGRLSDLTFYGRAVFDEQLRRNTLSFEQALAAARPIIKQREDEAGKTDGYSNPQIKVGAAIRERLARLQQTLPGAAAKQ